MNKNEEYWEFWKTSVYKKKQELILRGELDGFKENQEEANESTTNELD